VLALILDDSEMNNLLVVQALKPVADCEPVAFTCPVEALAFLRANVDRIGIVVTDYDMPGLTGLDVIAAARAVPGFAHVPIVMVTSLDQRSLRHQALRAGATDFLGKPCDPVEIQARVSNLMKISAAHRQDQDRAAWLAREVAAAVSVIEAREREIITLLMRAAEQRDTDTGDHIARVAGYVGVIARNLGFDPPYIQALTLASTMHDVGKIGVPDSILLKRGPLSPDERAEMEKHAERGRRILEGSTSDVVRLAAEIAESHHERWDGTGYPDGLAAEEIPLEAAIVGLADSWDAMTTDRPYHRALTADEALAEIYGGRGTQFSPAVVDAFLTAATSRPTEFGLGPTELALRAV
jgi:putative two-component system response regulator